MDLFALPQYHDLHFTPSLSNNNIIENVDIQNDKIRFNAW